MKTVDDPDLLYKLFLKCFTLLYNDDFSKQKIKLKRKDHLNYLITKGHTKGHKKEAKTS